MTEDSLVTPKAMRSLGTQLAYEHVCEFLREQGGSATTKSIQDHLARVALMETSISVHAFFKSDNWKAFRQGIYFANPSTWNPTNEKKYGPPLPIYVGKRHTIGEWDLIEVGACSPLAGTPDVTVNSTKRPFLDFIARLVMRLEWFSMVKKQSENN